MLKKIFPAVLAVFLCISCTVKESFLKDGYYTAMNAEFDSYGWKEYVTICASAGRIILIEFNAFNVSGFIKSWDMHYMQNMIITDGTYPNAYTRYFTRQALKNQGAQGVDALSGATGSYHSFVLLTEAAIENARLGIPDIRLVQIEAYAQGGENPVH